MAAGRFIAAAVVLLAPAAAQPILTCAWTSPNFTASYDVSALYSYPQNYIWTDPSDYETTNSTYIFNVCANIAMPPQWAQICPSGRGPAYQIINDQGSEACFALGTSLATQRSDKATWSLVDPTDPSRGVSLTYLSPFNDGLCPNGQPRSFTIDFGCADYPFPPPGQAPGAAHIANVDEVNMCNYRAHSWSRAGCPLQCPVVNNALCGGNGVCGLDKGQNAPRCFCYDDWTESDCQTPSAPYPGSAVAGAVVGGLLFGALVTIGGAWLYGWYGKMKAASGTSAAADAPVDGFYATVNA